MYMYMYMYMYKIHVHVHVHVINQNRINLIPGDISPQNPCPFCDIIHKSCGSLRRHIECYHAIR